MRFSLEVWQQEDGSWAAHVETLRLFVIEPTEAEVIDRAKCVSLEVLRNMLDSGEIAFETVHAA